jgi:hypothetical protein
MDGDKESPRLTPIDKSRGYLGADNLVYRSCIPAIGEPESVVIATQLLEDLSQSLIKLAVNIHAIADNFNPESLALTEPVPLTMHPSEIYLNSLGAGSRRTMREALNAIIAESRYAVAPHRSNSL